jgi:hypothetical protein
VKKRVVVWKTLYLKYKSNQRGEQYKKESGTMWKGEQNNAKGS